MVRHLIRDILLKIKEDIIQKKVIVSNHKIATDNSIPIETILFEKDMFKRVLKYLKLTLSYTQMGEAMIFAQRSDPQDVVEDADRLVHWLC